MLRTRFGKILMQRYGLIIFIIIIDAEIWLLPKFFWNFTKIQLGEQRFKYKDDGERLHD